MAVIFLLGLTLGLDSLRASLALGTIGLGRRRQVELAMAFALSDGLAPLAGFYFADYVVRFAGEWTEHLGALLLGAYAVHVIYASRYWADKKLDRSWILLGLPLSFSLDNLVAGASLGLVGKPALLTAVVFGTTSGLLSLAGFGASGIAFERMRPNLRWFAGVTLLMIAVVLELRPG
jgi:putative Mn2+ efflux pump MntP